MKKQLLFFILLITQFCVFAQVPAYYNNVNVDATGTTLKNALASKITSTHHTNLSYTPGVWNALRQTDLDPSNSSKVLLIYGYNDFDSDFHNDRTRGKNDYGGGQDVWNREHVYPKSLGTPNLGTSGAGADAHNLRPADANKNSTRGNRKFVDNSGTSRIINGNWYPGDEWKGDVARMIMYMYLRYGNRCLPKNVGVGSSASSDSNMLQLFLEWNAEDPVSPLELQRNPVLEGLQGNRNPFIDNPAFATAIWGGPQAEDRFGSGTTNPTPSGDDLFISEYVEGSSNNKAIEIVNKTGNTVNLSNYSLKKQSNGSGSWSSTYSLSGTLANNETYVIVYTYASSTLKSKADVTTNSSALTFNGNDPVGLFKNNTLIDVVGNYNGGSTYFAQNTTLERKSSVSKGNTTFNKSGEWNSLSIDTYSGLGSFGGSSSTSPTPTPTNYCTSKGSDSSYEWIDYVALGGMTNSSSDNGGYIDVNKTAYVSKGSNSITLSAGFSGQSYTEFWNVWIDFNKNGTFESSENVVKNSSSSSSNRSFTFTIPSSALTGTTKMRVSMKYDADGTACETFDYGEVEDYKVNISSARFANTNENVITSTVSFYPNPVTTVLNINSSTTYNYTIYDMLGKVVKKGNTETKQIDVQDMKSGVYSILLENNSERISERIVIRK
ncbi:endonuclease [Aureivirga marina]|uniref:endonuclease n=1 Tax=Aureivirga marina TaxID=1182451 RepID=UPI0018C90D01|nr:endonuclease [Aureivirga marina]